MSLPLTVKVLIAAYDEYVRLLTDLYLSTGYNHSRTFEEMQIIRRRGDELNAEIEKLRAELIDA